MEWVILGLVVLKLDVKTVFDADLHLDGGVELWICTESVDHNVHLLTDVIESSADGGAEKIPANNTSTHLRQVYLYLRPENNTPTHLRQVYLSILENNTPTHLRHVYISIPTC